MMGGVELFIRSTLFNAGYFAWTAFIICTVWILLPFPLDVFRRAIALWPVGTAWWMRVTVGTTYEIRGRDRLPPGAALYAVKHQSAWDTMMFLWLNRENAYVMKSELLKIPLWGRYIRKADHLVVDRQGGASALRRLADGARRIIGAGRSLVIFPEGTRVAPGTTGTYFSGVAMLAGAVDVPVVPVAVNSGLFWGRRKYLKKPGTIILEFLEPISHAEVSAMDRRQFLGELERRIETATRALEAEALEAKAMAVEHAAADRR